MPSSIWRSTGHYAYPLFRLFGMVYSLKIGVGLLVIVLVAYGCGWQWPWRRGPDTTTQLQVLDLAKGAASTKSDMQRKFENEMEEAPYAAKLRAILNMTLRFPRGASKILDHLYLGAEADATNLRVLRELGITHIINCAEGYIDTGTSFYGDGFKYLGFDAEDDWGYDIMQHFDAVYEFIEDARTSGGKVLIHCIMGVNRSGALTVSYLMVHKHMGPISAAKFVKKSRSLILSNEGFQQQVVAFARKHELLALDQAELSSTL